MSEQTINLSIEATLRQQFQLTFSEPPSIIVHAPGRVNLIGDHTDYNQGYVLPAAINFGTNIVVSPRTDDLILVQAVDISNNLVEFSLLEPLFDTKHTWSNYVRGSLLFLKQKFPNISGANLLVSGNVPQGAGLSSSASFEIALLKAFAQLYSLELSGIEAALIGQQAENDFVGCNCGIMDQLVSAMANARHAMLLDCQNLAISHAIIPEELTVLVINSKVKRGLVDSAYNERRQQCEEVARYFGKESLRDVSLADLESASSAIECILYKRARHVITENTRTLKMFNALNNKDFNQISELMAQSHLSLKNDFSVTVPETDLLVEIVSQVLKNQGGVRMTGGGFGGCVVALVPHSLVAKVKEAVKQQYPQYTGLVAEFYTCVATQGAFAEIVK